MLLTYAGDEKLQGHSAPFHETLVANRLRVSLCGVASSQTTTSVLGHNARDFRTPFCPVLGP